MRDPPTRDIRKSLKEYNEDCYCLIVSFTDLINLLVLPNLIYRHRCIRTSNNDIWFSILRVVFKKLLPTIIIISKLRKSQLTQMKYKPIFLIKIGLEFQSLACLGSSMFMGRCIYLRQLPKNDVFRVFNLKI